MSSVKFVRPSASKSALLILAVVFSLVSLRCIDPCPSCASAPAGQVSFEQTGSLHEHRATAVSQLVPGSNTALVAGGARFNGYLTSTQIFDPTTNTISNDAPDLVNARANHTATLLKDGTVLLTGGDNGLIALNSAEVYVPGKPGNFKQPGSMFAPRTHHTATRLKDGRVLIAGGSPAIQFKQGSTPGVADPVPNGANNSAELYDPSSGAFLGAKQAMVSPRTEHTATLLKDGTVLLTGGLDQNGIVLSTAEIFDPGFQSFVPTGSLKFARYGHTATLIQCGKGCSEDGEVLIVGGLDANTDTNNNTTGSIAELYDPANQTFGIVPEPKPGAGRAFHTAIALPDGSVLVAGGLSGNSSSGIYTNLNTAELYNPTTVSITPLTPNMNDARTGLMAAAYTDASNNPMVLLAFGGLADFNGFFPEFTDMKPGTLASTDVYNPASKAFVTPATITPSSPQTCPKDIADNPAGCAITRAAYTATTLTDGRILLAGGYEALPATFESAEVYDFASGAFATTAAVMHEPRVFAGSAQFANPASGILVAGGLTACDGSAELYQQGSFELSHGVMATTSSDSHRCEFFTATTLADGRVLLAGGLDGTDTVLNSAEIYDPATDTFAATAAPMMTPRYGQSAALLDDGTVLIAGGASCFDCMSDPMCKSSNPCPNNNTVFLQTAEIFNPADGTFSPTNGLMARTRYFGTATPLTQPVILNPGATVLLAGGSGDNLAELYFPSTGMFGSANFMQAIRFFEQATPLGNDLDYILISGGSGRNGFGSLTTLNSAEIFLPGSDGFCATGNMIEGRAFHVAAPGTNSKGALRVLVAGGNGDNTSLGSAELYIAPNAPKNGMPCPTNSTAQSISIAEARAAMLAARNGLLNAKRQIVEKGERAESR